MFKSVGRVWRKLAVLAVTAASVCGAAPTLAQQQDTTVTNPVRRIMDPLGIDIASAQFVRSNTHLTIGDPANGGLAWKYVPGAYAFEGLVEYNGTANNPITVKIEGNATNFSGSVNLSGTQSTLTGTGSSWIYTEADGTVYTFSYIAPSGTFFPKIEGRLLSIAKPNGDVITLNYVSSTNNDLQSVVSNRGYALKYVWNSSYSSATIYAINLAAHTCDASLNCDGYDGSITFSITAPNASSPSGYADQVTDALGNSWYYYVDNSFDYVNPHTYVETFGPLSLIYYQDPTGYSATVNYDGAGRIATFVDPRGTFNFNYNGQTVTQAHGLTTRTLTVTDPSGNTMYSAYFDTSLATMAWYKDGVGNQTSYNFGSYFVQNGSEGGTYTRLLSVTKPEGNSIAYAYDSRGNVTQVTNTPKSGSGLSVTNVYSNYDSTCSNPVKCNKPNWTEDAKGNYTYYTYDPTHGGVTLGQSPADSSGITPQTVTTWAQHTAQIRNSSGAMVNAGTIWLPQTVSTCASATTCNGAASQTVTTTAYNTYSLLPSSVTVAAGDNSVSATSSYSYDNMGNRTSIDGPRTDVSDISYTTYDADRRPVYEIGVDPDGSGPLPHVVTHHIYTGVLETQTETGTSPNTDGSSFTRASYVAASYNALGKKTLTAAYIDGNTLAQSLTQFNYDVRGRSNCAVERMNPGIYGSISATDACSLGAQGGYGPDRITKNTYDNADQLTEVDQAYGVAGTQRAYSRYSYNPNGTKATEMDADGNKTMYVYDGFDRLSQIQYPSTTAGSGNINTADYEQFQYDANYNKTVWRRRNGQTLYYNYDNLNREILRYVSDGSVPNVYTDYDLAGRPCVIAYGSDIHGAGPNCTGLFSSLGSTQGVHYEYNGLGWLAATTDVNGRSVSYAYNQAGVRTMLWYPDGNSVGYTVDAANRMTAVGYDAFAGLLSQSYDNLGHLYGQGKAGGSTTFVTDNLGRLSSLTNDLNGTANDVTWGFTYTPAGQVYQTTASSTAYDYKETTSTTVNQAYDGLNRDAAIASISGGYDANGNLTSEGSGGRTFTYDVYNHLLKAVSPTANLRLVYDPAGRLAQYSTDGGSTYTDFLYDGTNLIGEYPHSSTTPNGRYIHGFGTDNPLVWLNGSGTSDERWFYTDYHGSVIGYTDQYGNLSDLYKYGPYGEPKNASNITSFSGSRFRYTGQIVIPEAQLYYYKARVYDPIYGRFLQTDPIGSKDDLDLYAYTADDSVNAVDPTGTFEIDSIFTATTEVSRSPGGMDYSGGPDGTPKQAFQAPVSTPTSAPVSSAPSPTAPPLPESGPPPVTPGSVVAAAVAAAVWPTPTASKEDDESRHIGYHYTTLDNANSIGKSGVIAAKNGKVYFTNEKIPSWMVSVVLFLGFRPVNEGVVVFSYPSSMPHTPDPSIALGKIHYGSIRDGREGVKIIYAGKNDLP